MYPTDSNKDVKINICLDTNMNLDVDGKFHIRMLADPFHIRFIEYMPMGTNNMEIDRYLLAPEIKKRINQLGKLIPIEKSINDGPAERFKFESARGEIGFIRPISQHFCNTCNRLRLTASGQLRPCLMSDVQVDLKTPLRKECSDDELAEVFLKAVRQKPSEHNLFNGHPSMISAQMCAIGG